MNLITAKPAGVYIIEPRVFCDNRGWFTETYNNAAFEKNGLIYNFVQDNHSYSAEKGTLRGLHWQCAPHEEAKLVRCVNGSIWDVAVDVREGSSTYLQWFGIELSNGNGKSLYIPEGFAHGFITLQEHTTVTYQISREYCLESGRRLRWDDPKIGIEWPFSPIIVSDKDQSWKFL